MTHVPSPSPPPPPPSLDGLKPGALIDGGRYCLVRKLRAGGNGVVWLARHAAMDVETVVKFPLRWLRSGNLVDEQLEREARSLVAFSNRHPHIVNILDVGETAGRRFVVMQYMHNGSLQDYCPGAGSRHGDPAAQMLRSLAWLSGISDALDFVHRQGLIHRDVKPANVLLDESFSAYLADFGIATGGIPTTSGELPAEAPGTVLGSLPYIAPEVLTGSAATAASDQFALAVTVYEFALGTVPFPGDAAVDILNSQSRAARHWGMSKSIPGLHNDAAAVLRKALSSSPSVRYRNCSEFARELLSVWRAPPPLPTSPSARAGETNRAASVTVETMPSRGGPATRPRRPLPDAKKLNSASRRLRLNRMLGEDDSTLEEHPPDGT